MRTTLTLADDVAVAVERLRREEGLGLSEAVNRLVRQGLAQDTSPAPYTLEPVALNARIDYTNIGETLALLDELDAEDQRAG